MVENCPKCGAKPKHALLYSVLEVGEGITMITKLRPEQAHELYNIVNKEFQGNLDAAMRKTIELFVKHYKGTTGPFPGREPVRDATLGYECSKCGYVWKMAKEVLPLKTRD